jgi:ATP-binding cassette subfamily B protein
VLFRSASGGLLGAFTTAGTIAAFVDYLGKLFTPVQECSQKVAVLQRAAAALDKVFSLLDRAESIPSGATPLPAARGAVQLRDLQFGYTPGTDVLHGVDLDIQPGEVVALCGRTGSGKTTLGALLSRAYDGYRGSITLDGHELSDLVTADVRRAVVSVRQDVQLLPDTVRFNLTLGREVSDERLWEVLTLMRADDVIRRLGGLDATLDPGGRNLSGGEAQLVALTRTLLADPAVVVLDEATASVDPLTEARVQAAVDVVLSRKTTLVIAHRLTTVLGADRIVLLDAGRVVEVGAHAELMARDGAYAHLFRQQFTEDASPGLPG